VGIVKVQSVENWRDALTEELKFADELLVEEFVSGVEITVPILSGKVCEAVEIKAPGGFYDYDAKYVYSNGHTEYFCPPVTLSTEVLAEAKRLALYFYRAAGCLDILRVDFIVSSDGVPYMLEGNSIPGCTATSLVPKSARYLGISFEKMTSSQVYAALKRSAVKVSKDESAPQGISAAAKSAKALFKAVSVMHMLVLVLAAAALVMMAATGFEKDMSGALVQILAAVFLVITPFTIRFLNKLK
jgi:hypothetical protein